MLSREKLSRLLPRDQIELAILGCQIVSILAIQGVVILVWWAIIGPPYDEPDRLPLGLQLDPTHGVVHLAIGIVAAYISIQRQHLAQSFLRAFGVGYLLLAFLGQFTDQHLGMHLQLEENVFHLTVGSIALLVGFGLVPVPMLREDPR